MIVEVENSKEVVDVPEDDEGVPSEEETLLKDFANGTYQGTLADDQLTGIGVFFWNSGDFYLGQWVQNVMSGMGEYYLSRGGSIIGEFKSNLPDGVCKMLFPNGNIYYGHVVEGVISGRGVFYYEHSKTWKYCDVKAGHDTKVLCQGHGKPTNWSRKCFQVDIEQFAATLMMSGTIKSYFGFENQPGLKKNGLGVFQYENGDQFLGNWTKDRPNGVGIKVLSSGTWECGYFKDGLLNGVGRIVYNNGDVYYGSIVTGLFHGFGVYSSKMMKKWTYSFYDAGRLRKIVKEGNTTPPPLYWDFLTNDGTPTTGGEPEPFTWETLLILNNSSKIMRDFAEEHPLNIGDREQTCKLAQANVNTNILVDAGRTEENPLRKSMEKQDYISVKELLKSCKTDPSVKHLPPTIEEREAAPIVTEPTLFTRNVPHPVPDRPPQPKYTLIKSPSSSGLMSPPAAMQKSPLAANPAAKPGENLFNERPGQTTQASRGTAQNGAGVASDHSGGKDKQTNKRDNSASQKKQQMPTNGSEQDGDEPLTFAKHLQSSKDHRKEPLARSVSAIQLKGTNKGSGHNGTTSTAVVNLGVSDSVDGRILAGATLRNDPRSQTPKTDSRAKFADNLVKGKRHAHQKSAKTGNYSFGKDSSFSSTGECVTGQRGGGNTLVNYLESKDSGAGEGMNYSFAEDMINNTTTHRSISTKRVPMTCDRKKRSPNSCFSLSQDLRGSQQKSFDQMKNAAGKDHQRPNIYKLWLGVYKKERESHFAGFGMKNNNASVQAGGGKDTRDRSNGRQRCEGNSTSMKNLHSNSISAGQSSIVQGRSNVGNNSISVKGGLSVKTQPVSNVNGGRNELIGGNTPHTASSKVLKPITNVNGKETIASTPSGGVGYLVKGAEKVNNGKNAGRGANSSMENNEPGRNNNNSSLRGIKQGNTSSTSSLVAMRGKMNQSGLNLSGISTGLAARKRVGGNM